MPELAQQIGSGIEDFPHGVAPAPIHSDASQLVTGVFGTTISATVVVNDPNLITQQSVVSYTITSPNMTLQVHELPALDLQVITTGTIGNMTTHISMTTWNAWNRMNFTVGTTSGNTCTLSSNPWPAWNRLQNHTLPQIQRTLEWQEADRAAQARQQAEYTANQIKIEGEKAKARERAAKLLQEQLTPKQREELAAKGFFSLEVLSATGKRIYRINRGRSRNVQEVDQNGKILKTLCAHPMIQCPDEDTMLTQKLMLEACEPEFLKVANIQTHH